MQVEIGPRSLQDMIEGVARKALREEMNSKLASAKESADGQAEANQRLIISELGRFNDALPESDPRKMSPAQLAARIADVPKASRFFRRMGGLRGDDSKPEKDAI